MSEFSIPLRVYIEDTDAGGIVYYVNYFKYMERARTELLRHLGFDKPAILDGGKLLVVHSCDARYKASARLDEQLECTASFVDLGGTSVLFSQKVMREGKVLCEGSVRVVCVDGASMRPTPIPTAMKAAIEQHMAAV